MTRLDQELFNRGLTQSRSQAENLIKLGKIKVDGRQENKPSKQVSSNSDINIEKNDRYVSRAGNKLASVAEKLGLNFAGKVVLDAGSSTGGFTDFALRHGAKKVIAVDVGTNQLHPLLQTDERVELHEQTDIRKYKITGVVPDIVLIDVSFISLRSILPAISNLSNNSTQIVAMLKPQFESEDKNLHSGVIKNDRLRRHIIKNFEDWCRGKFLVVEKSDSKITGEKGNLERFYLLKKI